MSQSYKVSVDHQFAFELDKNQIDTADIVSVAPNQYHGIVDFQSLNATIISSQFNIKKYIVQILGTDFEVSIKDDLDTRIDEMGFSISAIKQVNEIKAPMPGLILDVAVEIGQQVEENQMLLILEAMKMENTLLSPRSGMIKSIDISKGQAVEKGQILITFE